MSHKDRNHTGVNSEKYRENHTKIFKEGTDDGWEKVEKDGKVTYRKIKHDNS